MKMSCKPSFSFNLLIYIQKMFVTIFLTITSVLFVVKTQLLLIGSKNLLVTPTDLIYAYRHKLLKVQVA